MTSSSTSLYLEDVGCAISTTGDEHRLGFLETSVDHWKMALPLGAPLFVTVDGDEEHVAAVAARLRGYQIQILRVGQRADGSVPSDGRLGVAANKNTGIEALIEDGVYRLFLCDDDTWPRSKESLLLHTEMNMDHSLVMWGLHRKPTPLDDMKSASWSWPRGACMYVEARVVDAIGGLREEFGPGGHEHVEWSRRIFQAEFTSCEYPSPVEYARRGGTSAGMYWHAEDMAKRGEPVGTLITRRRRVTSIRWADTDWKRIDQLFADCDGDTSFVPYTAEENGRTAATMSSHNA